MSRTVHGTVVSLVFRRSGWVLLAMVATVLGVTPKAEAQYVSTRHVRDVIRNGVAEPVGRLSGTQVMSLDVVLPLNDQTGLELSLIHISWLISILRTWRRKKP